MSGAINSIPASTLVDVIPSVLNGGGSALELIGLALTKNTRVPIGQVMSFPTALSVSNFFGASSSEFAEASVYFLGFNGSAALPAAMLFAQYPTGNVGAYLRGGNVSGLTLSQLQALSGSLSVTIDGTPHTASSVNLSSATSFTAAAQIMTAGLGTNGPIQAELTGSIGATFTGSSSGTTSLSATNVTGLISAGDTLTGSGISGTVSIVSQASGITGGAGVYVTSASTSVGSATVTSSSTILDVSAVASGTVALGQEITGNNIPGGTYITNLLTGTGGVGTYSIGTALTAPSEAITAIQPTVSFDSISGAFVFASGSVGVNSSIGFVSGTLAASLLLTQATGAVVSPGAAAATPSAFMTGIVAITTNWASFWTLFDPDGGSGNSQKLAFAEWNNGQNNQYLYAAWDTDITPTESQTATSSLGSLIKQSAISGTSPISVPAGTNLHIAPFLAGAIASIDFNETNGRSTLAYKSQTGLTPSVTNATIAENLQANGYNYYAAVATANQQFQFFLPGTVSGPFQWIDSYINQIWLNSQLQLALIEMLATYKSIPYNPAGSGIIRSACLDPILAAVNFGAIVQNVPLSNAQAAFVNNAAGMVIAPTLATQGWYLQILPTPAQVRKARGTPPMTLWYMDGESVQNITLASVLIQ